MLSLLNSCHVPDKKLCFSPQADGVSLPGFAFWLNALLTMEKALSQAKNPLLEALIPLTFAFGVISKHMPFKASGTSGQLSLGSMHPVRPQLLDAACPPTCH